MRRWNGWGDESKTMELPHSAGQFLSQTIGTGQCLQDASLTDVISQVPSSRLPEHPLVSTDPQTRVRHAKGQSLPDYLAMRSGEISCFPDGVCFPENRQDVEDILAYAKTHNVELIPYGGGTSVAGHINPNMSSRAVLTVDMSHMNQLLHLDENSQIATFGAGTPGTMVEAQLLARGYTLGHFPQSFELSTIGGWVASRSSGQQSLRYGRIEQLFAGGNLETFDGSLTVPTFPASSAGPDLREILLGSEGRFGILTDVKVRVSRVAEKEQFGVIFFPSWQLASQFCKEVVQHRIALSMLRVSNRVETQTQLKLAGHETSIKWLERYLSLRGCKDNKCMLTFGLTGSHSQISATKRQLKSVVKQYKGVNTGTLLGKKWQANRFRSPYLRDALWQLGYVVDTFETATDWGNVDELMAKVEDEIRHGLTDKNEQIHVFTHLSHVYAQGCSLYTTYIYRNGSSYEETLARWKKLKHLASETIINNAGTISHQHGVGKDHAPYLSVEKGVLGMKLLANLSEHFDEQQQLNPGTLLE
ncbi:FAD-binding oxidoreductase [Thalassotalea atypica]|uniref:FAD-binding oxidoreductase n=1 Tax=Thalassotalea atypica TaxID=2054316 RepID=UPI002573A627|nr:FAD-binding oxidoreductase [Thalassotalea atypica]